MVAIRHRVIVLLPAVPALFVLNCLTFIPLCLPTSPGPARPDQVSHRGDRGGVAVDQRLFARRRWPSASGQHPRRDGGVGGRRRCRSRGICASMLALLLIGMFQVQFYSTTNVLIQVLVGPAPRPRPQPLHAHLDRADPGREPHRRRAGRNDRGRDGPRGGWNPDGHHRDRDGRTEPGILKDRAAHHLVA